MGINAYVLCVGAFSEKIKDCLLYDAEFYEDTKPGTAVITRRFHCNTNDQSRKLAKVLGCDVWDFNTHRIIEDKVDWTVLHEMMHTEWDKVLEIRKLVRLLEAGFMCIFMPEG